MGDVSFIQENRLFSFDNFVLLLYLLRTLSTKKTLSSTWLKQIHGIGCSFYYYQDGTIKNIFIYPTKVNIKSILSGRYTQKIRQSILSRKLVLTTGKAPNWIRVFRLLFSNKYTTLTPEILEPAFSSE